MDVGHGHPEALAPGLLGLTRTRDELFGQIGDSLGTLSVSDFIRAKSTTISHLIVTFFKNRRSKSTYNFCSGL